MHFDLGTAGLDCVEEKFPLALLRQQTMLPDCIFITGPEDLSK